MNAHYLQLLDHSWTDLLEKLLPTALAVAAQDESEFREVGCN
jgi:hypothetical protein